MKLELEEEGGGPYLEVASMSAGVEFENDFGGGLLTRRLLLLPPARGGGT